jgi:mannose/cellobiose epimerase-like protein (N-acyl-D-glucosamine 2-epimerase family)
MVNPAVQTWCDAFTDKGRGGYYERLDAAAKPLDLPKRLLTQCRQIYVYGLAGYDVSSGYDFLYKNYRVPETGGSRFSLADDTYDLYGLSFILLACAAAGQPAYARETLDFIDKHFRIPGQIGFTGALDARLKPKPGIKAQNPHMHLLEGCLAMADISSDPKYTSIAGEIVELMRAHFFDASHGCLLEFFTDDGKPHPQKGHIVEAGHQAEWVWLLKRYQTVTGDQDGRLQDIQTLLFDWVKRFGVDQQYGGIFNAQAPDGAIIDDQKRIWPLTETIRAARLMGDTDMAAQLFTLLKDKYLRPDGFWHEILNRDLTPATDYLPGTTPYHIYPVLRDQK